MLFTGCFGDSNNPIFHSLPVCYLYVLPVCFEPSNLLLQASMLSICITNMLFRCSFEASNLPIFNSRPVCYLYVLPVCYLHAASKLRTTQSYIPCQYAIYTYCQYATYMLLRSSQSSIPGQYVNYIYCQYTIYMLLRTTQSSIPGQCAIYKYCQYAIYTLLRSFEPPNLPFPASVRSTSIASMLFTCCFKASNHPIFHFRPVCYLYVLPACYLHAASKLRTTQSYIPCQYAIYTYCQYATYMLLRSSQSSIPGQYVNYIYCQYTIYMLLRTTQSSIPGQCAIYKYCQYAIYMLVRSFEPLNLPFPASMLSIRIASMPCTCCFEASNHPIFYFLPVCYLYVLPVCHVHAASKLRTTQSSIPGQCAIYKYCQYAIYMLLRSFKPPNLTFPASMLSIRIASMPRTCCFEAPNLPFLASMLTIFIASILFTCCFEQPNLPFPASVRSTSIASMLFTRCFEASNHPIFHSRPVCDLQVLPVCYLHAASKLRTTQSSIPGKYAIYTYCQYAIYMLLRTTRWMDTFFQFGNPLPNTKCIACMCTVRRPAHCHHVMYVDNS